MTPVPRDAPSGRSRARREPSKPPGTLQRPAAERSATKRGSPRTHGKNGRPRPPHLGLRNLPSGHDSATAGGRRKPQSLSLAMPARPGKRTALHGAAPSRARGPARLRLGPRREAALGKPPRPPLRPPLSLQPQPPESIPWVLALAGSPGAPSAPPRATQPVRAPPGPRLPVPAPRWSVARPRPPAPPPRRGEPRPSSRRPAGPAPASRSGESPQDKSLVPENAVGPCMRKKKK